MQGLLGKVSKKYEKFIEYLQEENSEHDESIGNCDEIDIEFEKTFNDYSKDKELAIMREKNVT